jgi:hypothetical protein
MKKSILTLAGAALLSLAFQTPVMGLDEGESVTDMWAVNVDGSSVPTLQSLAAYPQKLSQSQVWGIFGMPDSFAVNQHDIYIGPGTIYVIYYGLGGESLVVIELPTSTH